MGSKNKSQDPGKNPKSYISPIHSGYVTDPFAFVTLDGSRAGSCMVRFKRYKNKMDTVTFPLRGSVVVS